MYKKALQGRVESMQQSSATTSLHLGFWGLRKIVACSQPYLAVPSCRHGVIPTSYLIFTLVPDVVVRNASFRLGLCIDSPMLSCRLGDVDKSPPNLALDNTHTHNFLMVFLGIGNEAHNTAHPYETVTLTSLMFTILGISIH